MIDTNPGVIHIPGRAAAGDRSEPSQLRRAVVHRRHRAIQQRRRDQDRPAGRHRAAEPVRLAVGFGHPVSPDFPGESPGIVWSPSKWTESALASVSMGYQVGVTPLQMVTAISAVANGGELRRAARRPRGLSRQPPLRRAAEGRAARPISADTAATLTGIMEGVVGDRTAPRRRRRFPATRSPARPAPRPSWSTATIRPATTTRRSSASFRRATRRSRSSSSPTRRTPASRPAARCRRRSSSGSPKRRCSISASPPTVNPPPPVLVARGTTSADHRRPVRAVGERADGQPGRRRSARNGSGSARHERARSGPQARASSGMTARVSGDGFVVSQVPAPGRTDRRGRAAAVSSLERWPTAACGDGEPAMTWAELHGALRGRGLIRADDALRAEAAVGAVTGVAYDSRAVTAGRRVRRAEGPARRRHRVRAPGDRARRRGDRVGAAGAGRRHGAVGDRRGRAPRARACSPPRSIAIRAARCRSSASPAPTARRRRRICSPAFSTRPASAAGFSARSAIASATRCARRRGRRRKRPRCRRCCARWSTAACGACAMEVSSHALALRRVDGIAFAAGDLHQPDARPSRLSRRHGRLLPRQAAAVRDAAARRAEPDQPRRSARRRAASRRGGRPVTYAINRPADVTPGPLSFSLDGLTFDVRTPRGTVHVRLEAGRPAERLQHPRRGRGGDGARAAARRDRTRPARARRRARPLSGRLRRQGRSHRRRRLRAYRRRAAQPARDGAAAGERPR